MAVFYQFDITLKISHPSYGFLEIKRNIAERLDGIVRDQAYESTIQNFIFRLFNDRLAKSRSLKRLNAKVFFADYRERDGSFIASFSILFLTTITNYGGIRENIDYFCDDLEHLFSSITRSDYTVSVDSKESGSPEKVNEVSQSIDKQDHIFDKKIYFYFGVCMFFIVLIITYLAQQSDPPHPLEEKEIKGLIKEAIDQYEKDRKLNILWESSQTSSRP